MGGEGEEAIIDIIDTFENGRPLSGVTGIVYKEGDQIVETKTRRYTRSLDSIPWPAWDLFNVGPIYSRQPSHYSIFKAQRVATIYTTRGCPFKCTFCHSAETSVRQRSVDNVMEEISELKRRYGVRHVKLADDLFVVRKKYAIEFAEALIKRKMNITWSATGRCNIVNKEFVKPLAASGMTYMGLGIESGSARVLKLMKKAQTPAQIINAIKVVSEAGIQPGGSFIFGMPPETPETIRETVALYKELNKYRKHANKFFFATPYPGTALYTDMQAKGKIKDEIKYFERLSRDGDAVSFCINCTDSMTDEELIRTKREVEQEVHRDFLKKNPRYILKEMMASKTPLIKLRNVLLRFKMHGFRDGVVFVTKKILSRLHLVPNQQQRRWNSNGQRQGYEENQLLVEGDMPTY